MFRGQLFAGRLFIGQTWARGGAGAVPPVTGQWTRVPRDSEVWVRVPRDT